MRIKALPDELRAQEGLVYDALVSLSVACWPTVTAAGRGGLWIPTSRRASPDMVFVCLSHRLCIRALISTVWLCMLERVARPL